MKKRADIIVHGEVKEAGYRAFVMKMAETNRLVGYVENLPNRAIHILCEGEEEDIETFLKQIEVGTDFVEIDGMEKTYGKQTGEFEMFEVKVQDMAYELFQGFATSGKYFGWLGDKVDRVGDRVGSVGDKVDGVGAEVASVGEEVRDLKDVTVRSFQELDGKYHVIAQNLERLNGNIERLVGSLVTLVEDHVKKEPSEG